MFGVNNSAVRESLHQALACDWWVEPPGGLLKLATRTYGYLWWGPEVLERGANEIANMCGFSVARVCLPSGVEAKPIFCRLASHLLNRFVFGPVLY